MTTYSQLVFIHLFITVTAKHTVGGATVNCTYDAQFKHITEMWPFIDFWVGSGLEIFI